MSCFLLIGFNRCAAHFYIFWNMWRGKQAAPSFLDRDPQHSWSSLCRKVDSSCSLTTCQSLVHKFTHQHCALLSDLGVEEVEGMGWWWSGRVERGQLITASLHCREYERLIHPQMQPSLRIPAYCQLDILPAGIPPRCAQTRGWTDTRGRKKNSLKNHNTRRMVVRFLGGVKYL